MRRIFEKALDVRTKETLVDCVRFHIRYPLERENLISALKRTGEFTKVQRIWIEATLPEGIYGNDREVLGSMGISEAS
jgi:hypothetical protein